jgi:hypothetical protein
MGSHTFASNEHFTAGIVQRGSQGQVVQPVVIFDDENSLAQKQSMVGCVEVIHSFAQALAARNMRRGRLSEAPLLLLMNLGHR